MNVSVTSELFARLAGRYLDRDVLLFEVSPNFIPDDPDNNSWSEPVRYRFVRREGAFVELEFHRIDLTAVVPEPA